MVTNLIFAIISMLFVAGLPLVAKSVGNFAVKYMETRTRQEVIHKTTAS